MQYRRFFLFQSLEDKPKFGIIQKFDSSSTVKLRELAFEPVFRHCVMTVLDSDTGDTYQVELQADDSQGVMLASYIKNCDEDGFRPIDHLRAGQQALGVEQQYHSYCWGVSVPIAKEWWKDGGLDWIDRCVPDDIWLFVYNRCKPALSERVSQGLSAAYKSDIPTEI